MVHIQRKGNLRVSPVTLVSILIQTKQVAIHVSREPGRQVETRVVCHADTVYIPLEDKQVVRCVKLEA